MRILMVALPVNHFFNWVEQFEKSGHEIYWFDVSSTNAYVERIDFINQIVLWNRIFEYPGRYRIKRNFPSLYEIIEKLNRKDFIKVFQKKLNKINPDVVHSFEMHSSAIPILNMIRGYPKIKWIYSSWGTDLFYYQNEPTKLKNIKEVLNNLDYMFADCNRDLIIARHLGFKGNYLGTFPGGGGYKLDSYISNIADFENRRIILIKGYQHIYGRVKNVLEALLKIGEEINRFKIIVFAANSEVKKFLNKTDFETLKNIEIKGKIKREEVLELMGKSFLYIGNSISDGIPNTLLEAIIMGAFPIQSNPGGATSEIIEHGKNGFLIENPEDSKEIAGLIKKALENPDLLKSGIAYNTKNIKPKLERNDIREQVLKKYEFIKENL